MQRAHLLGNDLGKRVAAQARGQIFLMTVDEIALLRFEHDRLVVSDLDFDPAQRTLLPREFHPRNEGILAAWVWVTLLVAGSFDLKRPVSREQLRRRLSLFPD